MALILGILLGVPHAGGAASVRLIWLPNDPTENVTNYNIYFWEQDASGTPRDPASSPLKHIAGLAAVTNIMGTDHLTTVIDSAALVVNHYYRFYATAENAAGESDPSLYAPLRDAPPYQLQATGGPANQPPTIQISPSTVIVPLAVADRQPISFTVADAETAAGSLTVGFVSGNPAVVPSGALVGGGSGGARTLTIGPSATTSGTSTITITVTDADNASASSNLVVTINASPRVSGLPATRVRITDSTVLAFTVADEDDAASSITGVAVSSNQAVLSNGEIVLRLASGQGDLTVPRTDAQWQLELNLPPGAERKGPVDVTLTFTDSKGVVGVGTCQLELDKTFGGLLRLPPESSNDNQTVMYRFQGGTGLAGPISITIIGTSNEALAPFLNIFPGPPSTEPTIMVRPVSGQRGSSTITFQATDGSKTLIYSFEVVIDPPTISTVADVVARAGTRVLTPEFQVRDGVTPASSIVMRARSLDSSLLPSGNVGISGNDTNRQISIDVPPTAVGTVTVELQAVDGDGWVTYEYFDVHIQSAVNDPPAISISGVTAGADLLVREGQVVGPLAILVGDTETPPASLQLAVVQTSDPALFPLDGIQLSGSGANRSLIAVPRRGLWGSAHIIVSVTDAEGASSSATLGVRVLPRPGADFDRDGLADFVFQSSQSSELKVLRDHLSPLAVYEDFPLGRGALAIPGAVRAVVDINADDRSDLVFQSGDGRVTAWALGGQDGLDWMGEITFAASPAAGAADRLVAVADLDRNGVPDLVFQTPSFQVYMWTATTATPPLTGVRRSLIALSGMVAMDGVRIAGSGDVDRNGQPDLYYQGLDEDGKHGVYLLELADPERVVKRSASPQQIPTQFGRGWILTSVNDYHWQLPEVYEAPGVESSLTRLTSSSISLASPDLLFQAGTGGLFLWFQDGLQATIHSQFGSGLPSAAWRLVPTR